MINYLKELENSKSKDIFKDKSKGDLQESLKRENHELFRWYYDGNPESEGECWVPYRIEENILIEMNYSKFEGSEGHHIFQGKFFNIDFVQHLEIKESKYKKIGRFLECPENIHRINYIPNSLSPIIVSSLKMSDNSSLNISNPYNSFMFKNIFPSKFFTKLQNLRFYFKSDKFPLILHISSGWSHTYDPENIDDKSTKRIVEELRNKGYTIICEIETDGKETNFKNVEKIPKTMINSIFETNWYRKYSETNIFIWEQLRKDVKEEIEDLYNEEYLNKGNHSDITLENNENYVVNYHNNKLKKENSESSIMRFHFNNVLPDEMKTLIIPESNFKAIRSKFDKNKIVKSTIFNSTHQSPTSFYSLIEEIKKEIYKLGVKLDSLDGVQAYNNLYLNKIDNLNFISTILKVYTDEGFLNRRINKILRDNDYDQLWEIKYFYFSLLYCLNEISSFTEFQYLYRGLNSKNEQMKQYKSLLKGSIITFNEFVSTTYKKEKALTYSGNVQGSILLEINIPVEKKISNIERYSVFEKEREVIFPPGIAFQFEEVIEVDQLTIVKLTLI